jgi:hypothetical protein
MRSRLIPAIVIVSFLLAACGSDSDTTESVSTDSSADGAVTTDATESDDAVTTNADESDDADGSDNGEPPALPSGDGTAVLTLANGETFEFSVLCSLESQIAAGSEILFTATSYDNPGLDITQFGDEGTVTEIASVDVYDADYETLWGAATLYEAFGGSLDLTLEGTTIRGVGTFYSGGDPAGEAVEGEVIANC